MACRSEWHVCEKGFLIIDGFFAESASLEKKFRGFQLFIMFLPELAACHIGDLLTDNLLRSLINHSSSGDRYLNKAAKKCVSLQPIKRSKVVINYTFGLCCTTGNHDRGL